MAILFLFNRKTLNNRSKKIKVSCKWQRPFKKGTTASAAHPYVAHMAKLGRVVQSRVKITQGQCDLNSDLKA